ncbi:hypothetical protein [Phormidesmis priestleyi]
MKVSVDRETMKAIEVTGSINEDGQIFLDQPISAAKLIRFRGVLLFPND